MDTVFTIEEIASKAHVSVQVLRREIKAGRLVAHKIGGRIFVFEDDWKQYLDTTVIGRQR